MSSNDSHFYEFGEFRLDADNPSLWRGGDLVAIFPKSLEILVLLVRRHGEVVTREELLETVWPETFVEESNITYTVSQLRKTLGRYGNEVAIQTIPKRGYRFVADVREVAEYADSPLQNIPESRYQSGAQFSVVQNTAANRATVLAFDRQSRALAAEIVTPNALDLPDKESKTNPSSENRKSGLKRWSGIILFAVISSLVALLGFAGFRMWTQAGEKRSAVSIEDVNFRKLTFTGDLTFPVLAPDGNSFAFVRGGSLFIQDVNSGDEIKVNVAGEKVFGILQFSRDGNSLYFRNRLGFDLAGNVFQVSRFGGSPKLAAENVWSGFGFSPDGRQMAFVRVYPTEAESSLIIKDLQTGAERKLTTLNLPSIFLDNGHPAWSADGKRIAVVIFNNLPGTPASELAVVDAETGTVNRINQPQFWQFEQVAWLPDSNDLIISARENGKFFQLWRVAYPGGDAQKITNDLNIYRGISLSADGKKLLARQFTLYSNLWIGEKDDLENTRQKTFGNLNRDGASGVKWMPNGDILYIARIMGDYDLWSYRPSDDSRRQLTKNAGELHSNPTVSSDGKLVFFNTNRSGSNHIWRMDASGANQTQITFGEKQVELFPQVSPDGSWLYYIQKGTTASTVWRQSLTDGRAEALSEAGNLAPGNFLSLSPDGKMLAFHNAVDRVSEDDGKQIYQVGLIATDQPGEPKFINIAASRLVVRWTSDAAALDYIENSADSARIWRQMLDTNLSPTIVVDLPKAFLHNFAWSADGKRLVMSRGQQSNDAILLMNFQP